MLFEEWASAHGSDIPSALTNIQCVSHDQTISEASASASFSSSYHSKHVFETESVVAPAIERLCIKRVLSLTIYIYIYIYV